MQLSAFRAVESLHVMAGGQGVGPEIGGELDQIGEFDGLIAGDARHRRLACGVGIGEGLDHRRAETLLGIDDVMRNADAVGDAAGVVNVFTGTARPLAPDCGTVVVELQRDADDLVPLFVQQCRSHGAIHSARHRHHDSAGGVIPGRHCARRRAA